MIVSQRNKMSEWKTEFIDGKEVNADSLHEDNSNYCSLWWRIANVVMAVFFGLSTIVQWNDPDAPVWMLIYGVPCLLCFTAAISPTLQDNNVWKAVSTGHLGASICGSIYLTTLLYSTVNKKSYNPLVYEEGRELGGVAIVSLWLAVCKFIHYRESTNQRSLLLVAIVIAVSLLPLALCIFYFLIMIRNIDLPSHCKTILFG